VIVTPEDIDEFSPGANTSDIEKCSKEIQTKMDDDSSYMEEIVELYKNNIFIVVKESLGSKDGSLGYVIEGDEDKAKSFAKGIESTKIYKEYRDCLPASDRESLDEYFDDIDKEDETDDTFKTEESDTDGSVEVWVDRWSHKLTSIKVIADTKSSSAETSFKIEVNTRIGADVEYKAPENPLTIKEIKKDIEAIQQEFSQSYGQSQFQQQQGIREMVINDYRTNNRGKQPTEAEIQQGMQQYLNSGSAFNSSQSSGFSL